MALTQSERDQITRYKIQIEGYRKDIENITKQKKQKAEYYASLIKNSKDSNSKRSYRQSKLSYDNDYKRNIETKKKDIERVKKYIANIKK